MQVLKRVYKFIILSTLFSNKIVFLSLKIVFVLANVYLKENAKLCLPSLLAKVDILKSLVYKRNPCRTVDPDEIHLLVWFVALCHSQQLWSCQDSKVTKPHFFWWASLIK